MKKLIRNSMKSAIKSPIPTAAALLCVLGGAVVMPSQAEMSLSVTLDQGASVESFTYDCSDKQTRTISYINSSDNALMMMDIDNKPRVFVNVLSASGARYVSGMYEWFAKGDSALFSHAQMKDGTYVHCYEKR